MTESPLKNYKSIKSLLDSDKDLQLTHNSILCIVCGTNYKFDSRQGIFNIKTHLKTKKHILNKEIRFNLVKNVESNETNEINKTKHYALLDFFTSCNIPLSKIDSPIFEKFSKICLNFAPKSTSYYKNNLILDLYHMKLEKIKNEIGNSNIYAIVDETTNSIGRHIICLLIGKCDKHNPSDIFLIKTKRTRVFFLDGDKKEGLKNNKN
jgi:hypothetical protein